SLTRAVRATSGLARQFYRLTTSASSACAHSGSIPSAQPDTRLTATCRQADRRAACGASSRP
ncbi:MAG: hypothetical protein WBP56_17090, partial [Polyangia bacterium]